MEYFLFRDLTGMMSSNGQQTDRNLIEIIDIWLSSFNDENLRWMCMLQYATRKASAALAPHRKRTDRPNRADRKSYPIFDQTDQSVGTHKTIPLCVHAYQITPW